MKNFLFYFLLTIISSQLCFAKDILRTDLAETEIKIRTSFSGAEIFIYGAIDTDTLYKKSLFIEVKGPDTNYKIRKKYRKYGIWIEGNKSINLENLPSYYAIVSNAAFDNNLYRNFLEENKILWQNLLDLSSFKKNKEVEEYYIALRKSLNNKGLFYEKGKSLEILNNDLFKAVFKLPGTTPTGNYKVNAYLVDENGFLRSKITNFIKVEKEGFIEKLFDYSQNQSLLYGICAALGAIFAGFLASLMFRRT